MFKKYKGKYTLGWQIMAEEDKRFFLILDEICGIKPKDKGIICKKRKK